MTGLFGVIGDPISHSLSPVIHRGWIRDNGRNADYRGLRVTADHLAEAMQTFERQAIKGLNVTLPHKQAVIAHCEVVAPLAARIGAVNTLSRLPDGGWRGDNTDHDGFLDDLADAWPADLAGRHVCVLGAGGAARAIVLALHGRGACVTIANRTVERARQLVADLQLDDVRVEPLGRAFGDMADAELVVNCLSLGHSGESLPLAPGKGRLLYDISYGPAARAILTPAQAAGWKVRDGLGMLVAQAARSFEIWFAIQPDRSAAMTRCRTALEAAL
jgi:shikimate dehydrogenase